jgi:hypothetical protein
MPQLELNPLRMRTLRPRNETEEVNQRDWDESNNENGLVSSFVNGSDCRSVVANADTNN